MTPLIALFTIVAILALLGGAAQRWGVDSRDGAGDSHQRAIGDR